MKIFIPSYGRCSSIKTNMLLGNYDYKIILHNEEEKEKYIRCFPELKNKIIVSNMPLGISGQRNWIINNLIEENEWACMMDDNIRNFNKFPEEVYNLENLPYEASKRYSWEHAYCNINELLKAFEETISKAESIGAEYCGFASIDNAFFRKSKWKYISLIVAKMNLIKKTNLRYNEEIKCIDDYEFSIQNLIKNGKVLVNSYIRPVSKHCEAGGLGKLEERAPKKRLDVQYLMNRYPGLLRIKERKNSIEGCEVALRFYSQNSINTWRNQWLLSEKNNSSIKAL